jgi:hypothetical protein
MPIYVFQHPVTEEYKELFFGMNDDKVFIDENSVKWRRVYVSSQLNTVGQTDPWSHNDFMEKTSSKKGTVGDMMAHSEELSEKRKDNMGYDPLKNKYFDNYSKKRGGAKHPRETKEKGFENKDIKITYD